MLPNWVEYIIIGLSLTISSIGFYKLGARSSRRAVVYTFNEILMQIYRLVWSGRQEELHEFLAEVCGEQISPTDDPKMKIIRHNKRGKGYKR